MRIIVMGADAAARVAFDVAFPGVVAYVDSVADFSQHSDAEIVSIFVRQEFRKSEMDALPNLKMIATRSTGFDHIDVAYAKERGIAVCNVPKYGSHTVAEFAFALLLALSRKVVTAHQQVQDADFTMATLQGFDLFGKIIGVVGTGAIGKNTVAIAQGFGMRVLMYDPFPTHSIEGEHARYVSFDELLACSDVISLHAPYTKENHHLINAGTLAKMKRGVYIINTARGELIDTQALLAALTQGVVAGAGLDVLEGERDLDRELEMVVSGTSVRDPHTIIRDHVLIHMPNVIATPHVAFFSKESYGEILAVTCDTIKRFIEGTPIHRVML